jgi:hypothetical protein
MNSSECFTRTASLLAASTKLKVKSVAPMFARTVGFATTSIAVVLAAKNALKSTFPFASSTQVNVLAFYLIGVTAAARGDMLSADEFRSKLNTMTEMGECEALRLQMYMERQSKLMEALSNLLKQSSETSSQIIQNFK